MSTDPQKLKTGMNIKTILFTLTAMLLVVLAACENENKEPTVEIIRSSD